MKLYYFKRPQGNFGDDLNPWLFSRLIPEMDGLRTADWLVGIGTILDNRLDKITGTKVILGSGVRVGDWDYVPRSDWDIIAVRGTLSTRKLGIDDSLACSDPGILVSRYFERMPESVDTVGFVPHYHSTSFFDCESIAQRAGCVLIRPDAPVEDFMAQLVRCDRVICEAMHGAIAADALGIPWKRINIMSWRKESSEVSDFKWHDWASQFGVETEPSAVAGIRIISRPRFQILNRVIQGNNESIVFRSVKKCADGNGFRVSKESVRQSRRSDLLERISSIRRQPLGPGCSRAETAQP